MGFTQGWWIVKSGLGMVRTMSEDWDNIVTGALKGCGSRESIEDTFQRYQINEKSERIKRLDVCMGSPQTFFSSDKISVEDKYELTIQMFLTESWKLLEIYDRIGSAQNG